MTSPWTKLSELLSRVTQLPSAPDPPPNYFEICGFPHYENVWSNVLGFFLDPSMEHGLSELVLESLLALVDQPLDGADRSNINVEREWSTGGGGRLDLLVETDSLVLGIENKVFAGVQNDLRDYERLLRALAEKDSRLPLGVVLSLRGTEKGHSSEFFGDVTHGKLAGEIRTRLGDYLRNGTTRYLPLLLELLANFDRTTDDRTMNADKELASFIHEHEQEISDLERRLQVFRDHLRAQIKLVGAAIDYDHLGPECKQYPYRPRHALFDILVHEIRLSPTLLIATNSVLSTAGWELNAFEFSRAASYPLEARLRDRGIETTPHPVHDNRFIWSVEPLPFDAETSEVAGKILQLLEVIAGLPAD
ncbi:MAG: PD-(D/E)XK nuclease family protein [Thermoanaerobaculia bacterium]